MFNSRVIEVPQTNHSVEEVLDEEKDDNEENDQIELEPIEPVVAVTNETESREKESDSTTSDESVILVTTKYEDENYSLDVNEMIKVRAGTSLIKNCPNHVTIGHMTWLFDLLYNQMN